MDKYKFVKLEKLSSKGSFIRIYDKKINVSSEALKKTTKKFDIFLDNKNKAILIKPNKGNDSRSLVQCKSSNTVSVNTGMPIGRYFFEEDFKENGCIFKLK